MFRIERVLGDRDAADLVQRIGDGFEQGEAALGRHHAGLGTGQQRIAGNVTQAPQGGADRGLRLVEFDRGAGDAAFDEQRIQHP